MIPAEITLGTDGSVHFQSVHPDTGEPYAVKFKAVDPRHSRKILDDWMKEREAANNEARKESFYKFAREHLKPQIIKLLKLDYDPSLPPRGHLPTCPMDLPLDGTDKLCNCHQERLTKHREMENSGYDVLLRDSDVRPTLHEEWWKIDEKRDNGRLKDQRIIPRAANRVLERVYQRFYPSLGINGGIGHHTTRSLKDETIFRQRTGELLGSNPIQVQARDHHSDKPKGPEIEQTSLSFLLCAWQHACAVGGLPLYAPWHNVYRPVGNTRQANKARLILRILEELGRHRTAKRRGWVQVRLTAICDALDIPRNNPRYTQTGELLDDLAKLRIVWASGKKRGRSFRLRPYVRP